MNVLDLPIRDGNDSAKQKTDELGKVLDLPIRDGNPAFPPAWYGKRPRFRPSYKGWKRARHRVVGVKQPSF